MTNFSETTKPKSDQLNADDLLGGSITIVITKIKITDGEQPVSVYFKNDNNKPYKPSKTMRRVMLIKWGDDADSFVGKSMTLYLDPNIKWAGKKVGGVAVSHMSDMKNDDRMLLTSTRGNKESVKIEHLKVKTPADTEKEKSARASVWARQGALEISQCKDMQEVKDWITANAETMRKLSKYKEATIIINDALDSAETELKGK